MVDQLKSKIQSTIKELKNAKITQTIIPTLWIPFLCILIGIIIGGVGERTTHITESIYPIETSGDGYSTEVYLRDVETEQHNSLEYNQSIQSHIDSSTAINSRAADTIREIERGQQFTSERVSESKAELNRAASLLEENRKLFESSDRTIEKRQEKNQHAESSKEVVDGTNNSR